MKKDDIEDVINDWGISYGSRKAIKKGRNICGGHYANKQLPTKSHGYRERLIATVRRFPEVMVKISGGGKDMYGIKAHMDYISRNGLVELEDEQGFVHLGKEDVRAIRDDWRGGGIAYEGGKKREAFNIVLSMPPGTDRVSVKKAVRDFASEIFGDHQYVFSAHNDEKHVHLHLCVKAVSLDGVRLNPRKADLQYWREMFSEKLKEHGIESNATSRHIRGVVKKAEKQVIKHINQEYARGRRKAPARVSVSQRNAADLEAREGIKHINPAKENIVAQRKRVHKDIGSVARMLAEGNKDEKKLALEIVHFVKTMNPVKTRHDELVEALKLEKVKQPEKSVSERKKQVVCLER